MLDTSAFHTYRTCVLNDLLAKISQEHLHVFKSVTVSARIKYPVGLYTYSFLAYAGAARKSVFLHKKIPLYVLDIRKHYAFSVSFYVEI